MLPNAPSDHGQHSPTGPPTRSSGGRLRGHGPAGPRRSCGCATPRTRRARSRCRHPRTRACVRRAATPLGPASRAPALQDQQVLHPKLWSMSLGGIPPTRSQLKLDGARRPKAAVHPRATPSTKSPVVSPSPTRRAPSPTIATRCRTRPAGTRHRHNPAEGLRRNGRPCRTPSTIRWAVDPPRSRNRSPRARRESRRHSSGPRERTQTACRAFASTASVRADPSAAACRAPSAPSTLSRAAPDAAVSGWPRFALDRTDRQIVAPPRTSAPRNHFHAVADRRARRVAFEERHRPGIEPPPPE